VKLAVALAVWSAVAAAPARYTISREPAGGSGSPQVVVLHDGVAGVEAAIAPSEGGELSSLRVRFRGAWVELIYRAREYGPTKGFRGKAEFLWPAVGGQYPSGTTPASSCVDGSYVLGGRSYPIPCHGFAKSLAWKEVAASADERGASVAVELRDSDATRASYPFGFRVRALYTLAEGRLTITYTVSAGDANAGSMPFSIGNHITFRLPFLEGTDARQMLFESPSTVELLRDEHGLVTDRARPRSFATPQRLGEFDSTVAIPLAGYRGAAYARLSDPRGLAVRIDHRSSTTLPEPLVQFNVYGGPSRGFLCPEPWYGLQNSLNRGQGLVRLAPGASWEWKVEIQPEHVPAT
jgi:galactose mutarotase-like enzyme